MEDGKRIGLLTYCHKCHEVYTGANPNCISCGYPGVMMFVAGDAIKSWVAYESSYDRMLDAQCGCCQNIIDNADI